MSSTQEEIQAEAARSGGYVRWPEGLHDDGQGGTVVVAIVREAYAAPTIREDGWLRFPGLRAGDYSLDAAGVMDGQGAYVPGGGPLILACVPLGASGGVWWHGEPSGEGSDDYSPWECTRDDLTPPGRVLVALLERLYKRPVELVTWIDT